MKLISLKMSDIRSHQDTRIEFPAGSILFSGDMGSGKSAILMAIEFALFGLGDIDPASLVSKKSQRGEVVLKFELDQRQYEIGRALIKKNQRFTQDPNNSYIIEEGEMVPLTPKDLKARILEILKFREPANPRASSRVFRYAVYTPQEEIKSILAGRDREEIIRKAFGMDDYKTTVTNAGLVTAHIKERMNVLTGRFERLADYESDLKTVLESRKDLEEQLKKLYSVKDSLENDKNETTIQINKLKSSLDDMNKLNASRNEMEKSITRKQSDMRRLDETIKKIKDELRYAAKTIGDHSNTQMPTTHTIPDIDRMIVHAQDNDRQLYAKKKELKTHNSDVAAQRNRLAGADRTQILQDMTRLQNDIQKLENRRLSCEEDIEEKNSRLGGLQSEVKSLRESLRKATSLDEICEYCGRPLEAHDVKKLCQQRQNALTGAEENMVFAEDRLKEARTSIQNINELMDKHKNRLDMLRKTIEDVQKLEELDRGIKKLESDVRTLESSRITPDVKFPMGKETDLEYLQRLRDALFRYHEDARRVADAQRQKKSLEMQLKDMVQQREFGTSWLKQQQQHIDDIDAQLVGQDEVIGQHDALKSRIDKINLDLSSNLETTATISERRYGMDRDTARLEGEIEQARRSRQSYDNYDDHLNWLREYFIPSLEAIERAVLLSILFAFDEYYRKWYSVLIDDPTKTSRIDDRFTPILEQDGYDQNVESLSGGEKTSVALAYRLALNSTVRQHTNMLDSNLLILDEPTDGFSRAQMEKVRQLLNALQSEQIIMVSHEAELEGYCDHIFKVTKSGGVSSIHKV